MNLQKYIKNNLLELKVIPNSKVEKLVIEENLELSSSSLQSSLSPLSHPSSPSSSLKLYLKAVPDKDKANKALIKFFKEHYHLQVQIKSGERSRNKVLVIKDGQLKKGS